MAWFDVFISNLVWQAIRDAARAGAAWTEAEAERFLEGLTPGQELSTSPLIRVLGSDGSGVTVMVLGGSPSAVSRPTSAWRPG